MLSRATHIYASTLVASKHRREGRNVTLYTRADKKRGKEAPPPTIGAVAICRFFFFFSFSYTVLRDDRSGERGNPGPARGYSRSCEHPLARATRYDTRNNQSTPPHSRGRKNTKQHLKCGVAGVCAHGCDEKWKAGTPRPQPERNYHELMRNGTEEVGDFRNDHHSIHQFIPLCL